MKITKLQLGSGRLEQLDPRVLPVFLDPSWLHLGDPPRTSRPHFLSYFREYTPGQLAAGALGGITRRATPAVPPGFEDPYAMTNFRPWFYAKGDRLPMEDGSINYIYSEHFLMDLFPDSLVALLSECLRMLAPGGVIRTVVPDADLRTYESPEPVGFPKRSLPFTHPRKHKTRFSVYLLTELLRLSGFEPVPLRFCDAEGRHVTRDPETLADRYGDSPAWEVARRLDHVIKLDSLIVDGVKPR